MRVLLIPPKNNYPNPVPKVDIFGQGFPYIAGALKKAGHEVFGLNMNHLWCNGSAPSKLAALVKKALQEYQPHLIGVGGLSGDYAFVRDTIRIIRRAAPDIPIVCGGGIVTYDREYIFTNLRPDFAVNGEAEETIVALANCLEEGSISLADIANIAFWENGKPVYTKVTIPDTKLEELSLPDFDPFDYERFLKSFNQIDHFYSHMRPHPRIMPISLGRSCPFKCTFCVHSHTTGPKYRERSIDNAINEIAHFYNKYHFNILFIYDEVLSLKKGRVSELCRRIKELKTDSGMDFDWTCDLRITDADNKLLEGMKDAGCAFIGYGLESASQKILNSMKKGTKVESIKKAIELTSEAGIGAQGNFIFGDIAETVETAQETLDFYNENCRKLMVFLSHIMPYPGSEIFQHCLDKDIIKDKQRYYEQLSPFGLHKINMSEMPDSVFFQFIDKIEKTDSPQKLMSNFKEASILLCERTDEFTDPEIPLSLRRRLYDIKVTCPHCSIAAYYLCPLSAIKPESQEVVVTYCTECHKRFIVLPHDNQRPRDRLKEVKRLVLRPFPRFIRSGIIRLYRALSSILSR